MRGNLFKNKDFRLLMLGKLVSLIGTKVQSFALSLYVFAQTGSATKFATMLAITIIPDILFGPFVGVWVDRFDRKKAIVCLDLLSGALTALCAFFYFLNGGLNLTFIYTMIILFSAISMVFNPTIRTVIPSIVKKDELLDANSINTLIMQLGQLISPMFAGFIYGVYGLGIVLIVNAISFVLSGISESFIKIPKVIASGTSKKRSSFVEDFKEGIKFTRSKKEITSIISMSLVLNFFFNPVMSIGLIYVVKNVYHMSDFAYGLLQTILIAGMIGAPIVSGLVSRKFSVITILLNSIFAVALLLGVFGFMSSDLYFSSFSNVYVAFGLLVATITGIAFLITIGNIALSTFIQQSVPNAFMGRVTTLLGSVTMAAVPLGQIFFGFLFDAVPPLYCILLSAFALGTCIIIYRKKFKAGISVETVVEAG